MKNVREFKRGETIYVAVAKDHGVEYEKRIFIAYIHGAWRPYVCVHEDDENDFIAGCSMFDTENWPDDVKALDEYTPMSKEQKEIERLRKRVEELERIIEMGAEIDWQ